MTNTIILKIENKNDSATVKELITALLQMPPNAVVDTEGCDCYGDAVAVEFDSKLNRVSIRRNIPFDVPNEREYPNFDRTYKTLDSDEELVILEEETKKLSDLDKE